jgi:hypothetical protein
MSLIDRERGTSWRERGAGKRASRQAGRRAGGQEGRRAGGQEGRKAGGMASRQVSRQPLLRLGQVRFGRDREIEGRDTHTER